MAKRAANFLLGKVVNAANTAATYIGDVVLQAGTAAIGTVGVTSVTLGASVYDVAEKTDLSTSAFQLASNANTYGVRVTNTSSNGNILYVGGANVSATRFIRRIYAGESGWFEVSNANLLYVFGSAASTKFTYGGY